MFRSLRSGNRLAIRSFPHRDNMAIADASEAESPVGHHHVLRNIVQYIPVYRCREV